MASRAKKIIDEKVESLKLLTSNPDIIVKYCRRLRIELLTLYIDKLNEQTDI